ncbi:MAG: YdeI/OmpD-associated family protein [Armatimonadetes bacterium]|nr:YdeI/OmpD-associated family protein [Armatimonadota bacterium]
MKPLIQFRTQLRQLGTRAFFLVPFDPNEVWGERDRHSVCGRIGGSGIRGVVARFGDEWGIAAGPAWRRDNPFKLGVEIDGELEPEGPQLTNMASDVVAALEQNPEELRIYQNLNSFCRKKYMRWVDSAKKPETRAKRIDEMICMLREKRESP